jgi:ferritin-like metal-binding protein YciE
MERGIKLVTRRKMNLITTTPESLQERLIEELRLIFDSEMQKVDVLWDMAEAAESPELKKIFTKLWDETLDQINHLEKIFRLLNASSQGGHSEDMTRLARGCTDVILSNGRNRDEGLLEQAERMWLHETAGYLTARTHAATLGHAQVAGVLQKILEEEQEAELHLRQLTQRLVRGNGDVQQPPVEFPGFGFREPELKMTSGDFQLGKESS